MPLTGQAKTDYQREYMRNRRAGCPVSPVQSVASEQGITKSVTVTPSVRPLPESVRPEPDIAVRTEDILSDLRAKAQAIIDRPVEEVVEIPVYNRNIHKPGDTVLLQGKVVIVEETDAEGNTIPSY